MVNVTVSGDGHPAIVIAIVEALKEKGFNVPKNPLISTGHSAFLITNINGEE